MSVCLGSHYDVPPPSLPSHSFFLTVPAKFAEGEEKFSVQSVKKGESAHIRCRGIGDEPLTIQWFRDKNLIDSNQVSRYDHFETRGDRSLTSELTIRSTERADNALYSCVVKNDHGQQEKSVKLVVVEVPEAPLDVRIGEVWSKSVSVSWSHPYSGNSQVSRYILRYWRQGKNWSWNQRLHEEELKPSVTSHIIKDLQPGMSYALTVTAMNEVGAGESSFVQKFTTGEEEPTSPPTDVHVESRGSRGIFVSWRPPPRHQWNGNITGYYVLYRPVEVTQPYIKTVDAFHTHYSNGSRPYGFVITGLTKSKLYMVSVKAYNKAGTGPASHELSVATLSGDPPQPPQLQSFNVLSRSVIKINWKYFGDDFGQLTGFTVYCMKDDQGHFMSVVPVAKHHNSFVAQNLDPGARYTFHVTASNAFGEGEGSHPLSVHLQDSTFGFALLMAKSNMLMVTAFAGAISVIGIAILASCCYISRAKAKHEEDIRKFQTLARTLPRRYSDKCQVNNRPDSCATYATIPADMRGPGCGLGIGSSESQSSGYGYGMPVIPDSMKNGGTPLKQQVSKDYEEIYDDPNC